MVLANEVRGIGSRKREVKKARVIIVLLFSLQVCLGHYQTKVTAAHQVNFLCDCLRTGVTGVTPLSPLVSSDLEPRAAPPYRPGAPASSFMAPPHLLHTLLNHLILSMLSFSSATPTDCVETHREGT